MFPRYPLHPVSRKNVCINAVGKPCRIGRERLRHHNTGKFPVSGSAVLAARLLRHATAMCHRSCNGVHALNRRRYCPAPTSRDSATGVHPPQRRCLPAYCSLHHRRPGHPAIHRSRRHPVQEEWPCVGSGVHLLSHCTCRPARGVRANFQVALVGLCSDETIRIG